MPTTAPLFSPSCLPAPSHRHPQVWQWLLMVLVSVWLAGCASLPSNVDRPVSTALPDPQSTRLGQLVQARAAKSGTHNDSGFALVGDAQLAFTTRMALIKTAQKTLDIQYYAIFADDTTDRMFEALREAAGRGVRIRILLDDFNTSGKNAQVLKMAFEKNIELRLFNPIPGGRGSMVLRILSNLKDVARIQRRMHNKMLVADNAVAITGGRNLGETYFGQSEGTNFVDIDVLSAGRIVRDLSRSFDKYWNHPLAYPAPSLMTLEQIEALKPKPAPDKAEDFASVIPAAAVLTKEDVNPTTTERIAKRPDGAVVVIPALPDTSDQGLLNWTWAPSVLLADEPSKIAADVDSVEEAEETAVDGLLQVMAQAKNELLIVSPYFVPGQRMMDEFTELRRRGVRVRVLTNSLASNDAPAAHVGYARYREALLDLGVELYEMRAEQEGTLRGFGSIGSFSGGSTGGSMGGSRASLHAKVVVMDQRLLVVGSMNLDLRSKLQNSEVALVIRSRPLSLQAQRLIEPALSRGAYHVGKVDGRLVWRAPLGAAFKDASTDPDASVPLRLLVKLLGPFAPDEML